MTDEQLPALAGAPEGGRSARIERFATLSVGAYWRAEHLERLGERRTPSDFFEKGRLYLLIHIEYADGVPHSCTLHGHPGSRYAHEDTQLLVTELVEAFEFEPDGALIRDRELAEAQRQIEQQSERYQELAANPDVALRLLTDESGDDSELAKELADFDHEAGLPSGGVSSMPVAQSVGEVERLRAQATNQAIVAKAHANICQREQEKLTRAIQAVTPFYTERGLAAQAQARSALKHAEKLNEGLTTLGLYTGDGVQVIRHHEGKSAPKTAPLALRQRLLYMDEESLINVAEGGADFSDLDAFMKALAEDPALLERVLPEPRGVVAFQYRRHRKDYVDPSPRKHAYNEQAFLLVRDGENLSSVHSSLIHMKRLFPTKDESGKPFRGVNGDHITVDELQYVRAKAASEEITLHYKRVLILLWGLYDREDLFGRFTLEDEHGGHVNFLSWQVQAEFFQFIYDDEPSTLLGDSHPSIHEWVARHNRLLQSGSRVACLWRHALTVDTAPVLFRGGHDHEVRFANPDSPFGVMIAERRDARLVVRPRVTPNHLTTRDTPFQATVEIDASASSQLGFLCLDAVTPEELDYFINNREDRQRYLAYIELFVAVREQLKAERPTVDAAADDLLDALQAGALITPPQRAGAREAVLDAIRLWRADHRGRMVPAPGTEEWPAAQKRLLEILWHQFGSEQRDRVADAEALCKAEGRTPLRLAVTGKGLLVLYATTTAAERRDRYTDHAWVQRQVLNRRKTKLSVDRFRWMEMPAVVAEERTIFQWQDAAAWLEKPSQPLTYSSADRLESLFDEAQQFLVGLTTGPQEWDSLFFETEQFVRRHSKKFVVDSLLVVPVGVVQKGTDEMQMVVLRLKMNQVLAFLGIERQRELLREYLRGMYRNKRVAEEEATPPEELRFGMALLPLKEKNVAAFRDSPYRLSRGLYPDLHGLSSFACAQEAVADYRTRRQNRFWEKSEPTRTTPPWRFLRWLDPQAQDAIDDALERRAKAPGVRGGEAH